MNTLLGEVATLNDVQFPRYRIAFKFRKIQKTFLLDHLDVASLQEVLHSVGVRRMARDDELSPSLLRTLLSELFSSMRVRHPIIAVAQLKQAQELCFHWMQMAFQTSAGPKVRAGAIKLALGLFSGSKSSDKAKFIFTLLANTNGAVEKDGLKYFCKITQQLASSFQEQVFTTSVDEILSQSLSLVRSAEDVEDDEFLDGGVRKNWLSQFEFVKVFSATPPPPFLSWLDLWHQLPALDKMVHPVRCAICTRKPIVSLRYQCSQCPNFHMCQMCFLKGRTTDKHHLSHKVLEFSVSAKSHRSWHHRLLGGSKHLTSGGKLMTEPRQPFTFNAKAAFMNGSSPEHTDTTDSPMSSINAMMSSSQQSRKSSGPLPPSPDKAHQPYIIRIGSGDSTGSTHSGKRSVSPRKSPNRDSDATLKTSPSRESTKSGGSRSKYSPSRDTPSPRKEAPPPPLPHLQNSPARRISYTSSSSSPDSVISGSGKFSFEGQPPPPSTEHQPHPHSSSIHTSSSSGDISGVPLRPPKVVVVHPATMPRRMRTTASDSTLLDSPGQVERMHQQRLSEINKRLSLEVDQLLSDLPPPPSTLVPRTIPQQPNPLSGSLQKLQTEETALQDQVHQLSNKRERLAHELSDLMSQVQTMHLGFVGLSNGVRGPNNNSLGVPPPPMHARTGSAPYHSLPASYTLPTSRMAEATSASQLPRVGTPPEATAHLMDPMVEYSPEMMNQLSPNWVENQRYSVAW